MIIGTNKAIVSGILHDHINMKQTQTGTPYCVFRLEVQYPHKDSQFVPIIAFAHPAENMAAAKKGDYIVIDGEISPPPLNDLPNTHGTRVRAIKATVNRPLQGAEYKTVTRTPKEKS